MATSDQSQHNSSVLRFRRLMHHRQVMMDCHRDIGSIDLDVAKAFDFEAAEEIDKRIERVEELTAVMEETKAMELKMNFGASLSKIFSSEGYRTFDDDIARWKELKEIREQMAEMQIDTRFIDKRIMNIFEVPIVTQPNSPSLATPARSPSSGSPSRKRGASVELDPGPGIKRQATNPPAPIQNGKKLDFWATGTDSHWTISVLSICMGDALYHVSSENTMSLQPDTETQTIQAYRSQLKGWDLRDYRSWVSVTNLHPTLSFSPKSVRKVIRVPRSLKARIIVFGSKPDGMIIDVTFVEPSGVLNFVSKLAELGDVCVEVIEGARMNEMFANQRLRKIKIVV